MREYSRGISEVELVENNHCIFEAELYGAELLINLSTRRATLNLMQNWTGKKWILVIYKYNIHYI